MILNPARLAVRRENPSVVFPVYYTTWQPPAETVGATKVATEGDFFTAWDNAVAAAVDCTIEITAAITIDLGNYGILFSWAIASKTLTVTAMVAGVVFTGDSRFFVSGGAILRFIGMEHRQNYTSSYHAGVENYRSTSYMQRCLINPHADDHTWYSQNSSYGRSDFDACIFKHGVFTGQFLDLNPYAYALVRNCVFETNLANALWEAIEGNTYAGRIQIYNSAFNDIGIGSAVSGTGVQGDYNASFDATAPGAHTLDNIIWANYYNANFIPQNAAAKAGGDVANAAPVDYLGNDLSALAIAPIGAIIAV